MRRVVTTPFPEEPLVSTPAQLGAAIRAARTATGLSLAEAAMALGVAKHTLTRVELATGDVGFDLVLRIASGLGVALFVAPSARKEQVRRALRQ